MQRLYIIGIGYKPLDNLTHSILRVADFILASERLSVLFKEFELYEEVKERVKVINNVDETFQFIRANLNRSKNIVILASGDPLFYGIGRRAVKEFGKDVVEIIPDLSSIQLAFSRIKESWDDAFLMSLHGGPNPLKRRDLPFELEDLPFLVTIHKKILILTDKENNPAKIAKELYLSGFNKVLKVYVCEKLGYPDERITVGLPKEIKDKTFEHPNLVIIINESFDKVSELLDREKVIFGISEDELSHFRGMITKDEVRAVTIHKIRPPYRGVLWDVGAGSGSISLECAKLSPSLKVYAIEKDENQIQHITNNLQRFNIQNVHIVKGEAPEAFKGLPSPQRVFIGGSGGRLRDIIEFLVSESISTVVINATKWETLSDAIILLQGFNYKVEVVQVSVSRMKNLSGGNFFSAINPVFVIKGSRQE